MGKNNYDIERQWMNMGKIILCSGKPAKKPFHFELTNTNIYSMEELCYYIYNNIYAMTEEAFGISLVNWMQDEIQLPEIANKLYRLISGHNGLKDIVVTILCGSDYYTEPEIKELMEIIDAICHLPAIKRQKIRADHYIKYGKYQAAAKEYRAILNEKEAAIFTEEEYGNIKHNEAVIKIHTASSREAAEVFKEAYKHNRNEDSLKAYLLALKLGNCQGEFEQAIMEYNICPELVLEVNQEMEEKREEAKSSPEYMKLINLEALKKEGKVNEYYNEINHLIDSWKQEYRQGILR